MRSVKTVVKLMILVVLSQLALLAIAKHFGMLTFISDVTSSALTSPYEQVMPLQVAESEITIDESRGLRLYQGQPFSGEAVKFYPSGQLAKKESFKQGLRDGYLQQWFYNGTLAFDSRYLAGQLAGLTQSWWSNGNLRSATPYVNGKVHGVSLQWYATGELFKKMNYMQGQELGLQQAWRRNGKLYSNYEYKEGRVYGLKRANMCVGLEDEELSLLNSFISHVVMLFRCGASKE